LLEDSNAFACAFQDFDDRFPDVAFSFLTIGTHKISDDKFSLRRKQFKKMGTRLVCPFQCFDFSYLGISQLEAAIHFFHCIENRRDRWMDQVNYSSSSIKPEEISDYDNAKRVIPQKEVKMSHED
jgi:hypothetical protein